MKRIRSKQIVFFLLTHFLFHPVISQEPVKDSIQIEEVVITGTKISVNRNSVPLTISVINAKQIEESSESALLPVLSEQVPGIFITERGITGFGVSTGSAGAINIRGIGGSPNTQTLILLNGNPQYMGIMGHPLPDAYIASDVEKVEIIRGPASTLYGSNAMGGVINIITKEKKEEGFNSNARVMLGSYNTQKYMVNGGIKKKNLNVFASFNHDQTEGHRDSSDFSNNNGYIRLGYDVNEKIKIKADFSLANFDATDPGTEGAVAGEAIDITRGMGGVSIDNHYNRISGSARLFYNFGEHNITDGFHSKDKNFGFVFYQSIRLFKGTTLTGGIDYKKYGGIAENLRAFGEGVVFGDTTVWEMAGYGYIRQIMFEKIVVEGGFRLEHNNVFGYEPVPSMGMTWHPKPFTTFKASVAKGFRSPTIRELYLWGTANENLNPERMINYEVSFLQKLMKERISFEITGYKSYGNNLIKAVAGTNGLKYQNTGKFSNQGIEFAGVFNPVSNLSLNVNYSFITMDEPVIATPQQQIYACSAYRLYKFSLSISLQHINNLYTQITPTKEKETYTLLNSKIGFKINKYMDVFIKGENLTNQVYYINYAYPMPGIIAFGGINLHY